MKIEGFSTVMEKSLNISIEGKPWSISIRRVDNKSDGDFNDYHKKEMKKDDIKKFIPDFATLEWEEINDEVLNSELTSIDGNFKINLITHNKDLKADNMLQDFLDFME